MKKVAAVLLTISLVAVLLPSGLTFQSQVPAFLWSPHQDVSSNNILKETVNYQTLPMKDLAKSVMSEGGWSNLLCGKETQQPVDIAILFVGRELHSLDISGSRHADLALLDLIKVSLRRSNFSLAFPYVAASEEEDSVENYLISEFTETCGHDFGLKNVAFLDSCSVEGENFEKLADFDSVNDYVVSRMEKRPTGQTDLLVFCHAGFLSPQHSESQIFSKLITSVEQSGAKYTVLYVSDPYRPIQYPSHRELERFLADSTFGNGSANSTFCDGVCQIKSSLLEGILVAIVLLIILISGLCCMMGIDTPTRFEAPQDS
ncbi:uncharacterized protein LOC132271379 [Cornus florida]|uniref:uncharacterized protein LOC132271379 n=1 Tax=Cornus florida TaxID=4283 RepID=UPI002898B5DB|nr:uncharacterized protein LOC132271379 [Cornus florida]XP_059628713.1 uncharacterized protein LOC132271379 [Cornus florida]XP_059628714.1 uncharacterized protein LOC132271379 [Cornus florida]XP_059628715.1 uncharacterized protein LOC132271379 [Cornus florida]